MPKKRKTRKQKILSEQKRPMVHNDTPSVISSPKGDMQSTNVQTPMQGTTFSIPTTAHRRQFIPDKPIPAAKTIAISTGEYAYLGIDLLKTAIITGAIVITEIIIRILFRG